MTPPRDTAICPYCGRRVHVRVNRFHDRVYELHAIAVGQEAAHDDYAPGYNRAATTSDKIRCPGSFEPVDE